VVSSFDPPFGGGREPSSLRRDDDGMFYGTASSGGRFNGGVLFQMDAAGVVSPLHSFSGTEGARPFGLVRASNGRFYGLTHQGGQYGWGTVFTFTPGSAPTTVHAFSDADAVAVDLFAAADWNVYGLTASVNNSAIGGVIFAIDPSGSYRPLVSIPVSAGGTPTSLVRARDGFYVTAQEDGSEPETIFVIDERGAVTNLHTFSGDFPDGPIGLMQRSDGRLYGTTVNGGEFDLGIVYAIDLDGTFRIVHSFNAAEGAALGIDLVETADGNLYGVTRNGLFTIDSSDTLTKLQTASGQPLVDLTLGIDERLYGPTASGGSDGAGTIITFDLAGTRTTIYEFDNGDGPAQPTGVIQAHDGRFYGATGGSFTSSGQTATGTVFAMDAAGTRTTLHTGP
jgi:uncharacterized repeat protein (TIGR03803 family)